MQITDETRKAFRGVATLFVESLASTGRLRKPTLEQAVIAYARANGGSELDGRAVLDMRRKAQRRISPPEFYKDLAYVDRLYCLSDRNPREREQVNQCLIGLAQQWGVKFPSDRVYTGFGEYSIQSREGYLAQVCQAITPQLIRSWSIAAEGIGEKGPKGLGERIRDTIIKVKLFYDQLFRYQTAELYDVLCQAGILRKV